MKGATLIAAVALVASCDAAGTRQHKAISNLSYDVPGAWVSQDVTREGSESSVWTPGDDNERKESVTVIRTERSSAVARSGLASVAELLHEAQIPSAALTTPEPIVTSSGLKGVSLHATYVPPGLRATYQRIHVVLVDGDALIHVLYTARTPDPDATAFHTVLDSLRHEEG